MKRVFGTLQLRPPRMRRQRCPASAGPRSQYARKADAMTPEATIARASPSSRAFRTCPGRIHAVRSVSQST